jgi:hypothetical protein
LITPWVRHKQYTEHNPIYYYPDGDKTPPSCLHQILLDTSSIHDHCY